MVNSIGSSKINISKVTGQSGSSNSTNNVDKSQKLAQENDKSTLDEALNIKKGGSSTSGTGENQTASQISQEYDKEVIEKAVNMKENEQTQQSSQSQQDQTAISSDAQIGGEDTGEETIPQASALQDMTS